MILTKSVLSLKQLFVAYALWALNSQRSATGSITCYIQFLFIRWHAVSDMQNIIFAGREKYEREVGHVLDQDMNKVYSRMQAIIWYN